MRLQTLRLHGFKSFADRTTLDFRDGVTAIIGSNGCGKSNIADAIRWALGEQRASAMRGAKMEEVIFQGTAKRRPLNLAEVTLHFDNQSGRVPIPQTEIELSRKVFREGGERIFAQPNRVQAARRTEPVARYRTRLERLRDHRIDDDRGIVERPGG